MMTRSVKTISANDQRKKRITAQRERLAARHNANPNQAWERNLFGAATVTKMERPKEEDDPTKPKISRAANGEMTGISFPDGRQFQGLNNQQVQILLKQYNERPLSIEEQAKKKAQEDEEYNKVYQEEKASLTPANVTPEQLGQVGQLSEAELSMAYTQDPETKALFDNYWRRLEVNKSLFGNKMQWPRDENGKLSPPPLLNKITGIIPGGKFKNAVLDAVSGDSPEIRRYLSDYSNEDTYDELVLQLDAANTIIDTAKDTAAEYGYSAEAIKLYNDGLQRKRVIQRQLKFLSQADQRRYVDKLRDPMIELETYFSVEKAEDDRIMRELLQTASPVTQTTTGGLE